MNAFNTQDDQTLDNAVIENTDSLLDDDYVKNKLEFIDRYKKASNTANSTIDDNSNVANKNVAILNAEVHKSDNIRISRAMVMGKLKELYPDFNAKRYVRDLEDHVIYKHDESSFAGATAPYTYSSKEVVYVKYNDKPYLVPFDLLYGKIVKEPEVLIDKENIVYQKYPEDLFIYDLNGQWSQVTHLTKKKRHRDLVRVKTIFGEDIVVTDNHPMIIDKSNIENTIPAIDSLDRPQYKIDTQFVFDGIQTIDLSQCIGKGEVYNSYILYNKFPVRRFVSIDRDFGYFVGFFIGDGNYSNTYSYINFTQKDPTVLYKLNDILYNHLGIVGKIKYKNDTSNCYNLFIPNRALFELLYDFFMIQDKSQEKTLPANIFSFTEDFALGLLEGLLDSDGTIHKNSISYRLSSRSCILQISALLKYFGYSIGNCYQHLPFSQNKSYHTTYTVWGVNTTYKEGLTELSHSFKFKDVIPSNCTSKYKPDGCTRVFSVTKLEDNDAFVTLQNDYIYDITTVSRTFALNNILVHNCVSITMYPFLLDGIKGVGGLSASPKNLKSFCGIFCNMIFAISSQFQGAVAVSEALLTFTYYCKKEWGPDFYLHSDRIVETNYEGKQRTILDEIHQYWQQIIYTINQPAAARGFQSAFVNFSYFDKYFFEGMFGDFCFPDGTKPDWESLKWIQMEFMKWFNNERLKTILTFPVETVTLLHKDGKFLDEEMFNFVCDEYSRGHSFFTYISDTVDSLSSCCFDRDTRIMYSLKGSSHYEKCISIGEAYDKDHDKEIEVLGFNPYTNERKWVSGKFVKASSSKMYKITLNDRAVWTDIIATSDHILPILRDGEVKDITVADLRLSDKLLADKAQWYLDVEDYSDLEYVTIDSIVKINDKPTEVYCVELDDSTSPYFVLANGIITHNCRLKNKLQTKEFNFTNGNISVMTGSKSVITFNLSRLVQAWYRKETEKRENFFKFDSSCYPSLKKYLVKLMDRVYKYHHAYNELLWDMYDADLLPAYKAGFIHLNKQYLTLGINGLNQAAEFLGMTCNVNDDYAKFCQEIFSLFKEQNELHKDTTSKHHLIFNTEQVPAESLGVKNLKFDKEDEFWTPEDTNLYASYVFKPNDPSLSVLDKIKMHGRDYIGEWLDGGSACHINLDSHLSTEQYKLLLNYAANEGCSYLTFNVPNSECRDCGYIAKVPIDECPKCGGKNIDLYDRVIGYLTKIKNWSSGRQKEFEMRVFGDIGNYKTFTAK